MKVVDSSRSMARAVKPEPFYDDSSTESEPYDEPESERLAAAPSASDGVEGTPKREPPASVSASAPSHSVLDLAALSPTPAPPVKAERPSPLAFPVPINVKMDAQARGSSPDAVEVPETCAKCGKGKLGEAARLTPRLAGQDTIQCSCCGLTLPTFCFTALQRAASSPACRGCRGVPTVIASLTTRVKKMLSQQESSTRRSTPPARVVDQPETPSSSPSSESTGDAGVSSVESEATCVECRKATLAEAARITKQLVGQETYYCHCCKLTLVAFCFTAPQRSARKPVCRGCRGAQSVVASLTSRIQKLLDEQQQAQPSDSPTAATPPPPASRKQPPCEVCQLPLTRVTIAQAREEGKVPCSCCARELPATFFSKAQLNKCERRRCKGCLGNVGRPSKEKVAAGLKAWMDKHPSRAKQRRLAEQAGQPKLTTKQKRARDRDAVFRNRVQRYKFAVRALARKRAENDLRGSTRIEYMKELAKEEAALLHQAKLLREQNPAVFRQVIGSKVKRPRMSRDREDLSDDSDDDLGELLLNSDAPASKRRRTEASASIPLADTTAKTQDDSV